jgi:hypothetical protein
MSFVVGRVGEDDEVEEEEEGGDAAMHKWPPFLSFAFPNQENQRIK